MTKKTVFGLLIISLLVLGGCSKKNSDPNDLEKVKVENAALKAKIQQLEQTKVAVVEPNIPPIPKKETNKDANEVVRVSKPFFGIYLGEKLDELNKRFRLIPSPTAKDEDDPTQSWVTRPDNANIVGISVNSFEGQVYSIFTVFKDASKENFEALKTQLKQLYGKEQDFGFDGIAVGSERAVFYPTIDGIQIFIQSDYRKELFGKAAYLVIIYRHEPLNKKVDDEIKRRKLAKVKGDL